MRVCFDGGVSDENDGEVERVQKRNVLLGVAGCRGEVHADPDQPPGRTALTNCSFTRCCGTEVSKFRTSVALMPARHAMPVPQLEAFSDLSLCRAGETG